MALHIADLFEHAVDVVPQRAALVAGRRVATYADLEASANRLAHFLGSRGVGPGDHVAVLARNSIEHVIALLAVVKIRAVTINVNYRYIEGELDYLLDNADVRVLIHEHSFAPLVAACWPRHPALEFAVVMPDALEPEGSPTTPAHDAVLWEQALARQSSERDFAERSSEDTHVIYTGGTTGLPKGVLWRHEDWWRALGGGIDVASGGFLDESSQSTQASTTPQRVSLPLSPLMHGSAQSRVLTHLFSGHLTVLQPRFDPDQTWRAIAEHRVQLIYLTGDAMARPLIEAYEAQASTGAPYGAGSLEVISSSAAILSPQVRARWVEHFPAAQFSEAIGATETGFLGIGVHSASDEAGHGFSGSAVTIGPETVVLDDQDVVLDPATDVGRIGRIGRIGSVPLGYYKDPVKSAATFIEVDGRRCAVPGDRVRLESPHRVTLLGRGANCINTGGEKVFPEEVEMALKGHPAVYDALVVAVSDATYGQAVAAVVQLRDGNRLSLDEVRAHLRGELAGYKLPRALTLVDQVPRSPAGKAQYAVARRLAEGAAIAAADG